MKKHNFYAGPSILSEYTIKNTAAAIENFAGMGLSLMEISHRSKEFVAVNDEARALIKELLDIPAGYEVVFLGGGASMQFCMVPYNLLNKKAAYLDTGTWASKAIKEAKLFGEVDVVASSKDKNYTYIPKNYSVPEDADYFHITTNNTIYGTELRQDPDVKVRLVADMSSDIFSRPIDVSKYDIIYAMRGKEIAQTPLTEEERGYEFHDIKKIMCKMPDQEKLYDRLKPDFRELLKDSDFNDLAEGNVSEDTGTSENSSYDDDDETVPF